MPHQLPRTAEPFGWYRPDKPFVAGSYKHGLCQTRAEIFLLDCKSFVLNDLQIKK
jgi:hypothetical protein